MNYDKELSFLLSFCEKYHLNSSIFSQKDTDLSSIDIHLRQMLGLESEYDSLKKLLDFGRQNCIYHVQDDFYCQYYFLPLPGNDSRTVLSIGPFTDQEPNDPMLMSYAEKYSIPPHLFKSIQNYFCMVPFIKDDTMLQTIINTFAEKVWGDSENYTFEFLECTIKNSPYSIETLQNLTLADYTPYDMYALESRYVRENELIQAVAHGQLHKAESIFGNSSSAYLEPRTSDSLRNLKNYIIVLNTLLRKAAEAGTVHPYQIDYISSDFAKKIEQLTSLEAGSRLMREMIRKYCLLVKNHSMKKYSSLIQRAVKIIDADLTADLSLKAIAKELNVNPSYLSSQFKKVTDITLTDYVNQKRIEYAILLLNTTSLQIQTIAQYCGISDVNYFTKIFKKIVHKTPSDYRKGILNKL